MKIKLVLKDIEGIEYFKEISVKLNLFNFNKVEEDR